MAACSAGRCLYSTPLTSVFCGGLMYALFCLLRGIRENLEQSGTFRVSSRTEKSDISVTVSKSCSPRTPEIMLTLVLDKNLELWAASMGFSSRVRPLHSLPFRFGQFCRFLVDIDFSTAASVIGTNSRLFVQKGSRLPRFCSSLEQSCKLCEVRETVGGYI